MIRLVEVFGVHMLKLDLRQHSDRHGQALDEIFRWAGVCPTTSSSRPTGGFELPGARARVDTGR